MLKLKWKVCTSCELPRRLTDYNNDCKRSDGKKSQCRECSMKHNPPPDKKKCYRCKEHRDRNMFGRGTSICNVCRNLNPPDYSLLYKVWTQGTIQRHYFSNNRIYGGM